MRRYTEYLGRIQSTGTYPSIGLGRWVYPFLMHLASLDPIMRENGIPIVIPHFFLLLIHLACFCPVAPIPCSRAARITTTGSQ
ncbi:hypothetical protein GGR53DRAFT_503381 [Hypoxylon sp. FL1150]|nr:hypothetical protein GGR53DRAFT_503381 [Hypoxylon sp. FL1150]